VRRPIAPFLQPDYRGQGYLHQPNPEERGTEQVPPIVKVIPTKTTPEVEQREKTKEEHDRRLADYTEALFYATPFLGFATFGLAVVAFFQMRDARKSIAAAVKSADVAERALIELERPYLVVEVTRPGIAIGVTGYSLDTEGTEWAAINYGRTPALLIDSFPHWPIEAGAAMPYAINPITQRGKAFPAGCVAGADRPYHETVEPIADADLPKLFSADVDGVDYRLFFTGYVRYGDFFGGVYLSGFCFVFEPAGERFVRIGGDAYNYNRTEKEPGT
jgi:hypothetical protein